jgi:hypothetical protein
VAVYLTPAEFIYYFDRRRLTKLASDEGQAAVELNDNPIVLVAIRNASAELDSNLQRGGRYSRQTMEDICEAARDTGLSDADRAAAQKRAAPIQELVAQLAYGRMLARRGLAAAELRAQAPQYEDALRRLEQLAGGASIFDNEAAINAGKPQVRTIGRRNQSITALNRLFSNTPIGGYFGTETRF